ncbi:MAG TPA: LON peptidase substrate-binding domain-containing protein [Candidatus Sulfotelmatobacter sp.]|nr:LON peptidase substrate-binding domain-containing protein [Candidatus Sulfotelmatobacter sp.]
MEQGPRQPVPVFPLPGLVLFPHVAVPLHIFELRYRTMVRDALSAERMIALALLKPGWEQDYAGSPEFHPLACLARIENVEWLPNDCYDLLVRGVSRVRLARITREYPYRAASVELRPQHPYPEDDPLVRIERKALLDACQRLAAARGAEPPGNELAYEALVNAVCAGSPMSPAEKLALLELDSVIERGRQAREWLERRMRAGGERAPGSGEHN